MDEDSCPCRGCSTISAHYAICETLCELLCGVAHAAARRREVHQALPVSFADPSSAFATRRQHMVSELEEAELDLDCVLDALHTFGTYRGQAEPVGQRSRGGIGIGKVDA